MFKPSFKARKPHRLFTQLYFTLQKLPSKSELLSVWKETGENPKVFSATAEGNYDSGGGKKSPVEVFWCRRPEALQRPGPDSLQLDSGPAPSPGLRACTLWTTWLQQMCPASCCCCCCCSLHGSVFATGRCTDGMKLVSVNS